MADEIFENIEENNATEEVGKTVGIENLKVLENIDVEMTVEVGRTEITIRDLLRLNESQSLFSSLIVNGSLFRKILDSMKL